MFLLVIPILIMWLWVAEVPAVGGHPLGHSKVVVVAVVAVLRLEPLVSRLDVLLLFPWAAAVQPVPVQDVVAEVVAVVYLEPVLVVVAVEDMKQLLLVVILPVLVDVPAWHWVCLVVEVPGVLVLKGPPAEDKILQPVLVLQVVTVVLPCMCLILVPAMQAAELVDQEPAIHRVVSFSLELEGVVVAAVPGLVDVALLIMVRREIMEVLIHLARVQLWQPLVVEKDKYP
jgi:hypothetical protein